jgi:hypothetical protein
MKKFIESDEYKNMSQENQQELEQKLQELKQQESIITEIKDGINARHDFLKKRNNYFARNVNESKIYDRSTNLTSGFLRKTYSSGNTYMGDYDSSQGGRNGIGRFVANTPDNKFMYFGDWKHGKRDGYGIQTQENLEYQGYFKDDKKDGYGSMRWNGNKLYEGQFKNDKRNGIGMQTNKNGNIKIGIWEDDKFIGYVNNNNNNNNNNNATKWSNDDV